MSVRAFSSLPMRPIVTLVILCFIVTVLSPASGLASMSVKEEKELGDRLALEIQQKVDMVNDPLIKAYVDEVGRRLVEESHDRRFDYRFYVVKEQTPNAFAIPGGHIFVTSGLIQFVDTEDELAGVIGHEIAHSVLRHIDKAMDRAKRLSLLTLAAIIAGAFLSKDAKGAATLTTGAMAMGVPGWPELACWMASMHSVRRVSMERFSRSAGEVMRASFGPEWWFEDA